MSEVNQTTNQIDENVLVATAIALNSSDVQINQYSGQSGELIKEARKNIEDVRVAIAIVKELHEGNKTAADYKAYGNDERLLRLAESLIDKCNV